MDCGLWIVDCGVSRVDVLSLVWIFFRSCVGGRFQISVSDNGVQRSVFRSFVTYRCYWFLFCPPLAF